MAKQAAQAPSREEQNQTFEAEVPIPAAATSPSAKTTKGTKAAPATPTNDSKASQQSLTSSKTDIETPKLCKIASAPPKEGSETQKLCKIASTPPEKHVNIRKTPPTPGISAAALAEAEETSKTLAQSPTNTDQKAVTSKEGPAKEILTSVQTNCVTPNTPKLGQATPSVATVTPSTTNSGSTVRMRTQRAPRPSKRHLVRWTTDLDMKLLLGIQSECNAQNVILPWNGIAALLGPKISGGAVIQHLAKTRSRMVAQGLPVPPPLRRGGGGRIPTGPSGPKTAYRPKAAGPKGVKKTSRNLASDEEQDEWTENDDSEGEYGNASRAQRSKTAGKAKRRKIKQEYSDEEVTTPSKNTKRKRVGSQRCRTYDNKKMETERDNNGSGSETETDITDQRVAAGASFLKLEDDVSGQYSCTDRQTTPQPKYYGLIANLPYGTTQFTPEKLKEKGLIETSDYENVSENTDDTDDDNENGQHIKVDTEGRSCDSNNIVSTTVEVSPSAQAHPLSFPHSMNSRAQAFDAYDGILPHNRSMGGNSYTKDPFSGVNNLSQDPGFPANNTLHNQLCQPSNASISQNFGVYNPSCDQSFAAHMDYSMDFGNMNSPGLFSTANFDTVMPFEAHGLPASSNSLAYLEGGHGNANHAGDNHSSSSNAHQLYAGNIGHRRYFPNLMQMPSCNLQSIPQPAVAPGVPTTNGSYGSGSSTSQATPSAETATYAGMVQDDELDKFLNKEMFNGYDMGT